MHELYISLLEEDIYRVKGSLRRKYLMRSLYITISIVHLFIILEISHFLVVLKFKFSKKIVRNWVTQLLQVLLILIDKLLHPSALLESTNCIFTNTYFTITWKKIFFVLSVLYQKGGRIKWHFYRSIYWCEKIVKR